MKKLEQLYRAIFKLRNSRKMLNDFCPSKKKAELFRFFMECSKFDLVPQFCCFKRQLLWP